MRMQSVIIAMVSLFMGAAIMPAQASIDEGIEYKTISPSQPTSTKNKVEVIELFWYGCPHCYHFEPKLKKWLETKPDNVVFIRVPAIFNPKWELHARAYYTAEALGVVEKIHGPLFDEIHKEKKHLHSVQDIRSFFARFGVKKEDFDNTFNSFIVISKVNRAKQLTKSYQIEGVPTMVINGKYRTSGPLANGQDGMLKVMNFLIHRESSAK